MIQTFLQKLRTFPSLLKSKYPDIIKFLHESTDKKGQGTGNMPTLHESCFAHEAFIHGFTFLKNSEVPMANGAYLKYQPNGTQKSIDFVLIEKVDDVIKIFEFDLKHTNSKSFFWNDGWFENGVIYVISYTVKKNDKLYIGFGHETPTPKDVEDMDRMVQFKKKWNSENKDDGFLKKYVRFANRYSCDQFTDEFTNARWASVESHL